MYAAKFALNGDGQVILADVGAVAVTGAATLNGGAYLQAPLAVIGTTEAVAASDGRIGGFRYRADGALRIYDATAAVPAGSSINQGVAMTSDGQLCYNSGDSTAFSVNGVALDSVSRVYALPLTFALEFADLGAGVVDTAEAVTGATPTFTRATAATTVLSNGLIGTVASGDPRSYYDPTTLEYLGYLAEGARTNLCLQSEDLATTWAPSLNGAVTANTTVAPDGTTTGDTLTNSGGSANDGIIQDISATGAQTYSNSWFVKQGTATVNRFVNRTASGATFCGGVDITWTAGVPALSSVAGTGTISNSSVKQFPNGWWRVSFTMADTFTTNIRIEMQADRNNSGGTVILWGAGVELAAFVSSYIPTTTAAVTRNADVLTYPTTGWLNASAGTIYAEATASSSNNSAAEEDVVSITDGTSNERISLRRNITTSAAQLVVVDGGVSQCAIGATAISAGASFKQVGAYALNDFAHSLNGGTVSTDASGTLPTVDQILVGGVVSAANFYGPIRRVAYYAARLANATLQALTSG